MPDIPENLAALRSIRRARKLTADQQVATDGSFADRLAGRARAAVVANAEMLTASVRDYRELPAARASGGDDALHERALHRAREIARLQLRSYATRFSAPLPIAQRGAGDLPQRASRA